MTDSERVMVDIETLGTEPGAAILSVGAVRFDTNGPQETFDRSITLKSCEAAGLTVDADTLEWWLSQDDAAQAVLSGGDLLEDVLASFAGFVEGADEVWANSPAFDCALLAAAYDACELPTPWAYYDERDYRTLSQLPVAADVDRDDEHVEHDALDDALYQARVVAATLREMGGDDDE